MTGIALSDEVKALATAVQSALVDPATTDPVDRPLASFAIGRHRVGPVLHQGIERGALTAKDDAATLLLQDWTANKTRCSTSALTTARIGQALAKRGIGYLAFKGVALAEALYPAPTWRHCGDIDILVPPDSLARAADALRTAGLEGGDPVFSLPGPLRAFALNILRDVRIDDRTFGHKIELHSRPVFSQSISGRLLAADPTFRPRLPERVNETPVPAVGACLATYLLLHGAVSGWTRLKWLTDILCILRQLDEPARANIARLAESAGTVKSVKAGLHLAAAAFPAIELGPLRAWLDEPTARAAIRQRTDAYAAWLSAPSDATANPLHTRNSALRSTLLLVDSRWAQAMTLPPSGLASSLRVLAQKIQAGR